MSNILDARARLRAARTNLVRLPSPRATPRRRAA